MNLALWRDCYFNVFDYILNFGMNDIFHINDRQAKANKDIRFGLLFKNKNK